MTMKFLQDVKTGINTTMPDNNTGEITPAILRSNLQDMVDSLYNRSAALIGDRSAAPLAQALTTVPTNYPNLYTSELEVDPAVVTADLVSGVLTPNLSGFICEVVISFTCSGANGRVVTATLDRNGTLSTRVKASVTCSGAGNLETASFSYPLIGVVAGDVYKMMLSTNVNDTITFSSVAAVLRVIPTYQPV